MDPVDQQIVVSQLEIPKDSPRGKMINTAVSFLKLPQVQSNPLKSKQEFLRTKGLTEEEVRLACEIAGAIDQIPVNSQVSEISNTYAVVRQYPQRREWWTLVRDIASVASIIVGVFFVSQAIYQKYLYKYFTNKKDRKPSRDDLQRDIIAELKTDVSDKLLFVQSKLSDLDIKISKLVVNQEGQDLESQVINKQIDDIKIEVLSLKGLLLNRKQFPAPSQLSSGAPSIPSWQLKTGSPKSSSDHHDSVDSNESNKHTPDHSEGSEPEIIIKDTGSNNGSDSSLEIVNK